MVEESLAAPQQDGLDRQMHLVDQAGAEILRSSAAPMPSPTKWNVVPSCIVIDARGW
jgi:hypothetical protein